MARSKRKEVRGREIAFILVALVAVVLSSIVVLSYRQGYLFSAASEAGVSDLSTDGFVAVTPVADVVNGSGFIRLTGSCYQMDASSDAAQAQSIKDGLDGIVGPRPNTHELMRDAFGSLGVKVLMVKVTELRDHNFFGKLLLQQNDKILSLDAKPSDGMALAIRTNATIYFNETLLKAQGEKIC